ncbi:MAG TPA: RDD family protein [Actinomycetes bacterium]
MVERKDVASWLEGPGAGRGPGEQEYAGQRLGRPAEGPGSVAGFGPRIVAYLIDSLACTLIAYGLLRDQRLTLLVFALEVLVLTWLAGGSAGQLVRGLRVVRLDGRPIGLWRAALRTVLLLLLIPALIWDRDGRGLHDKAAGSLVVRSR